MRRAVRDVFFEWNTPLEGYVTFMYLDQHYGPDGKLDPLVTTGVGNLIDPLSEAIDLPWQKPDGSLASRDEVARAWNRVKLDKTLNPLDGGVQYAKLTNLRLSKEAVAVLVRRRLIQNHEILAKRFAEIEEWPADAQLGIHSLAWAYGATLEEGPAPYVRFCKAADRADFATMALECSIKRNPARSKRQKELFESAARVVAEGLDFDVLGGGPRRSEVQPVAELGNRDPIAAANQKAIDELVRDREPNIGGEE